MIKWLVPAIIVLLSITTVPVSASVDFSVCEGAEPLQPVSQDCVQVMESFPEPTVLPITPDLFTLSNYSFWHVNRDGAPVFAAPGGGVTRDMGPGFNFVNVIDSESSEGWVKISTGEWMRTSDVKFYRASNFQGVRILNGLENRFAWVLGDLFSSPYPGAPQDPNTGRLLFRYDMVNIFAETVGEDGWRWYMIGPDQWVEQRMVAKVFKIDRPEDVSERWVAVDLYEQTLVAYENDMPVYATLVSSGLPGTETNEGVFEVWAALERDRMSGFTGAPNAYDLEGVPWVMYFDDSISLHGTYWHDVFGYRASRGCVNLSISDANFVYNWFEEAEGEEPISHVYVHSSGEYREPGR